MGTKEKGKEGEEEGGGKREGEEKGEVEEEEGRRHTSIPAMVLRNMR